MRKLSTLTSIAGIGAVLTLMAEPRLREQELLLGRRL
jgi:hypothetical protein